MGRRAEQLREANARLEAVGRVVGVSSFYETEPVEFTGQPWFLNCALVLETDKTAEELMAAILAIEEEMGRRRLQKKGPRLIDIDILMYAGIRVSLPDLIIPHPRIAERAFVLVPLAEIAPDSRHPGLDVRIQDLAAAVPGRETVQRYGPPMLVI